MRIAGVRLDGGRMVWAEAAEISLETLQRVVVRLPEGEAEGRVFVTPQQLMQAPETVEGTVISGPSVKTTA
jgi:hypothetical protein